MKQQLTTQLINGPIGQIELLINEPQKTPIGLCLICHPHPLYGGSNTNKVVNTIAKAFGQLGYISIMPNFRGVGKTQGHYDHGNGETEDSLATLTWALQKWPNLSLSLAGFSFGSYIQTKVAQKIHDVYPLKSMVLAGLATGTASDSSRAYTTPDLPPKVPSLIIHGENDEIIPLQNVLTWARTSVHPIMVIPDCSHFFHGKLMTLKNIITSFGAQTCTS